MTDEDRLPGDRPVRRAHRGEWFVAGVAFLCFVNTLSNGYVYDSIEIVERNPLVHEPGHWLDLWTFDHWHQEEGLTANRDLLYRPVALASYRLVRTIGGAASWPQHLVNALLHGAICLLVVRFSRKLLSEPRVAAIAGLLFAVLPIHSEVVNDIVGRTDLIVALGVLVALLAHRRVILARATREVVGWCSLAAVAVFCAMGAKENGIAVLGLIPLFDGLWWLSRRSENQGKTWLSWHTVVRLAYLVIPAVVYSALRYNALGGRFYQQPALSKTINVLVGAPAWQHILGTIQAWGMYWQKTVWPTILCPDYSVNAVRLATSVWEIDVIVGLVVAGAIVAASVTAWRRGNHSIAACAIALILCYAPASNAFKLIQVFFAERIWYLPSVLVAILLAAAVGPLMRRRIGMAVLALVLAVMFARCWVRNSEWKDNASLAAAAYRDHPDSAATLVMYGNFLATSGQVERGIALLTRATQIDPGFTVAHRALGKAYGLQGDYRRSLHHWQVAEMQFPGHPEVQTTLSAVSEKLSASADSDLARLRQAADERPEDVDAELAYLQQLLALARHEEVLTRQVATESRFAEDAAWQQQYAVTLLYAGRSDEAIERYRTCLTLAPQNIGLHVELAAILMERQEGDDLLEAERLLTHVQSLSSEDAYVNVLWAELLALRGDLFGALATYRQVLAAIPADHPQRKLWETRVQVLGGQ